VANFMLNKRDRIIEYKDADEVTVKGSNRIPLLINSKWFYIDTDTDLSTGANLDTGAVAAGKDYYVYACDNAGALVFLISLASTYPAGYDANTSRKIGGFHTLCVNVGTIAGHTLTDYTANSILPQSVWDLKHRPRCEPAGMVWSDAAQVWVDIYLASGTGASTVSVNGGTISDTRDWMDFVDDFGAVKKRLLTDIEFQLIAAGSNEETNIVDSADPVTTGGHSDTGARRMISNIGCEDCCGALNQWLITPSVKLDDGTVGGWIDLAGAKGSFYTFGTNGYANTQLLAGGYWADGEHCGSRCRYAFLYRWGTNTPFGGRGCAEPQ
ncbi:MAG: hypothetical protein ABIG63_19690, partial [Chloroflexota bacterium]